MRGRGNTYQVRVYAGTDPLTGRANYLTESAPTEKQAHKALRRLTSEVEDQRAARTKATLGTAVDTWLKVHEGAANTLRNYQGDARRYIKPALGNLPLGKTTARLLEEFYARFVILCRDTCCRSTEVPVP